MSKATYTVDELNTYFQRVHVELQLKYGVYPDSVKAKILNKEGTGLNEQAAKLYLDQTYLTPLEFGFIPAMSGTNFTQIWPVRLNKDAAVKLCVTQLSILLPGDLNPVTLISTGLEEATYNCIADQGVKKAGVSYDPSTEKRKILLRRYEPSPKTMVVKNINIKSPLAVLAHYLGLFANARIYTISKILTIEKSENPIIPENQPLIDYMKIYKKFPDVVEYFPTEQTFDRFWCKDAKQSGVLRIPVSYMPEFNSARDSKAKIIMQDRSSVKANCVKYNSYEQQYPNMPPIGYLELEHHLFNSSISLRPSKVTDKGTFAGTTIICKADIKDPKSPVVGHSFKPASTQEMDSTLKASKFGYTATLEPKINVFDSKVYIDFTCKMLVADYSIKLQTSASSELEIAAIGNCDSLTEEEFLQQKGKKVSHASQASTAESTTITEEDADAQ